MKHHISVDHSEGAECVLCITHITENENTCHIFDRLDEDKISDFIAKNIGEQINSLNGCPIYMEVAGWAYNYCGTHGDEYSLDPYDVDEDEWKIEICFVTKDNT